MQEKNEVEQTIGATQRGGKQAILRRDEEDKHRPSREESPRCGPWEARRRGAGSSPLSRQDKAGRGGRWRCPVEEAHDGPSKGDCEEGSGHQVGEEGGVKKAGDKLTPELLYERWFHTNLEMAALQQVLIDKGVTTRQELQQALQRIREQARQEIERVQALVEGQTPRGPGPKKPN